MLFNLSMFVYMQGCQSWLEFFYNNLATKKTLPSIHFRCFLEFVFWTPTPSPSWSLRPTWRKVLLCTFKPLFNITKSHFWKTKWRFFLSTVSTSLYIYKSVSKIYIYINALVHVLTVKTGGQVVFGFVH